MKAFVFILDGGHRKWRLFGVQYLPYQGMGPKHGT